MVLCNRMPQRSCSAQIFEACIDVSSHPNASEIHDAQITETHDVRRFSCPGKLLSGCLEIDSHAVTVKEKKPEVTCGIHTAIFSSFTIDSRGSGFVATLLQMFGKSALHHTQFVLHFVWRSSVRFTIAF